MEKKPKKVAVELKIQICNSCRYGKSVTVNQIECHRFPAQMTGWVVLKASDHCGEWKQEKEPSPSP